MRTGMILIVFFSEKVVNLMARKQPLDAIQRMTLMIQVSSLCYLIVCLCVVVGLSMAIGYWVPW